MSKMKTTKRVGVVGAIGIAVFGTAAAAAVVLAGLGELRSTVTNVNAYLIGVGNNIISLGVRVTTLETSITTEAADILAQIDAIEADILAISAATSVSVGDPDAFIGYIFDTFGISADTALDGVEHLGNRLVDNLNDLNDATTRLTAAEARLDTADDRFNAIDIRIDGLGADDSSVDISVVTALRADLQTQTERVNGLFNTVGNNQAAVIAATQAVTIAQATAAAAQLAADTNTADIDDLETGLNEVISILNGLDDNLPTIPVI